MKFAILAAFLSAVVSAVQATQEPSAAASVQNSTCHHPTVPFLRAYNPDLQDHFYTTSTEEMHAAVDVLAYRPEGDAGRIHPKQTPITIPLYRLYNQYAYDHFYTTNATERDAASGYDSEGVAGYVYETQVCGTVPLYRMWSQTMTDHFYTTDEGEMDNAVKTLGYAYEGIAAYVKPA